MIIIKDTPENLQNILIAFNSFGVVALTNAGREFTEENYLLNINGKGSVTKTYDVLHEDAEQGSYITHPEAFRGRWSDEYIDGLIDLIPDTATIDLEFIPTVTEEI